MRSAQRATKAKQNWEVEYRWKFEAANVCVKCWEIDGKSRTHTHHVESGKERQYVWHSVGIVMRFLTKNTKRHRSAHTALTCAKQRFNTLIKSLFFWPTNFSDLLADAYDVWQWPLIFSAADALAARRCVFFSGFWPFALEFAPKRICHEIYTFMFVCARQSFSSESIYSLRSLHLRSAKWSNEHCAHLCVRLWNARTIKRRSRTKQICWRSVDCSHRFYFNYSKNEERKIKRNTSKFKIQTEWLLCEHKESSLNMVINLMSIIRASDTHTHAHKSNKKNWAYMGNATKHTCVCGAAVVVVRFFFFQISIVEWPIQCYRFRGQTHHAFGSSVHLSRFTDPIVCADQQTTNENQSFVLL